MDWQQAVLQLADLVIRAINVVVSCVNIHYQKYTPKHFGNKKGRHF